MLRPDLKATIVTNSPPAAEILSEHPAVEVILVGGQLQKSSRVIAGSMAIEMIRGIRADLCLLGICSIHPRVGISVASVEEAMLKRAMIESAAEVIALASPEKLGTVQPFVVGEVSRINILVTPRSVPDASLAPYQEIGMEIIRRVTDGSFEMVEDRPRGMPCSDKSPRLVAIERYQQPRRRHPAVRPSNAIARRGDRPLGRTRYPWRDGRHRI